MNSGSNPGSPVPEARRRAGFFVITLRSGRQMHE
jgi:hypothetical protein